MSKFVHNINDAISALNEQIDILQNKADNIVSKPKILEKYTDHKDKEYMWSMYENMWGTFNLSIEYYFKQNRSYTEAKFTKEHFEKVLKRFDDTFAKWEKDNQETHKKNQDNISFNLKEIEKVKLIMSTFGINSGYSTWEYKRRNSMKSTEIKHTAGFLQDIRRVVQTQDNYDNIVKIIQNQRCNIEDYYKKHVKEYEEQKRLKDEEEKKHKKIIALASLRAKYTTDNLESNEREIRDSILSKNKYLHLAYWLEMNRSDWNDGYSYAEIGLNSFDIENSEDELIHDDISGCIENWDSDGRVFRDTTYNYTVIYAKVDNKELLSDLELLLNYCEFN